MELADILAKDCVLFCAGIHTKTDLLQVLAKHAAQHTGQDANAVFSAIKEREDLGSTGLGNGIAIPHGKFSGLGKVTAVFARLAEPIDFDAMDDEPVDLIVLLLAPLGAGADHLKALARVARLLRTESLVEDLRRTQDPEALYDLLSMPLDGSAAA
jgi:nitrogen PTS system EIIA component